MMAPLVMQQNQSHHHHHHHHPVFRTCSSDSYGCMEQNNVMLEKRQLFLRSYQFCRKKSLTERIRTSLFRVKRVMWLRLRSACKIRKLVWSRFRWGFHCRRRRFVRLINHNNNNHYYHHHYHNPNSNCFW